MVDGPTAVILFPSIKRLPPPNQPASHSRSRPDCNLRCSVEDLQRGKIVNFLVLIFQGERLSLAFHV